MTATAASGQAAQLDRSADLETVLAAWHDATLRLQNTHETLRAEVERLRAELEVKNRELARKNRLADLGQMASHVAHEVRNNLVPVELYMSLLRRRLRHDQESLAVVDKIAAGVAALDTTVNDLLHFTSDRLARLGPLRLARLLEDICTVLAPQAESQGVTLIYEVPLESQVHADGGMLRRALLNLVLNALDVLPQGGQILLTVCLCDDGFEIEVADSGPGFAPDALQRGWEPFFTTKSNGTGLGLAIVDRIAAAHGGRVTALNCAEGGAAVTIFIPQHTTEKSQ